MIQSLENPKNASPDKRNIKGDIKKFQKLRLNLDLVANRIKRALSSSVIPPTHQKN